MNNRVVHKVWILFLLFCFGINVVTDVNAAADARRIMEAVYRQDTSQDTAWQAFMDVYDKKGGLRRKKFVFRKLGALGNSKTLVRFLDPGEVRGVGLLTINQGGQKDRQWLYTPAIQRTRRIAPQERDRRFLGTDFTNEDMQERVLDDFSYKMIIESDWIDGRKTYKIEARPVAPDRSQYQYIYLWVPVDVPYVILAQMFDKQGKMIREYHATDLVKISNIWVAKKVEMASKTENTRTLMVIEDIKFNTGLNESLFSQQTLERPDVY